MRSTLSKCLVALLVCCAAFGSLAGIAAAQGEYVSTTRFLEPAPVSPTGDEVLAEIQARRAAANTADEVLGVSQTPASPPLALPELAFTGSSVSMPLALGSILVGAGGMVLLVARKREHNS